MKTIRNLILSFLFIVLSSFGTQQSPIYQHLGNFNFQHNYNTNVGVSAYVTKHYNVNKAYGTYKYVYYLKMMSNSHNNGVLTSTWLYNTRVHVDGSEVSYQQTPYGFTAYIRTTETIVYTWYTNNDNVNYGVTWGSAVYDPRNIK
jgi:hypothetical protein